MRRFALLCEELESRPDEVDRVAALARYLRDVGRATGAVASEWVLHLAEGRLARRPARVPLLALAAAAVEVAEDAGTPPWLFAAGRAAEPETAEAIALLLPWPDVGWRPALDEWLDAWRAAVASATPEERARPLAATVARLDDALSRRWAVRAACGLARPLVEESAWLRAWSAAFGEDRHALAWRWHVLGRRRAMAGSDEPGAEAVPHPRPFAAPDDVEAHAADHHAALLDALAARELWLEPQWAGLRVQVVRRASALGVWLDDGALLNARLPADLLAPEAWPDPCAIEGVLVGWQAGRVVSPWLATGAAGARRARPRAPPVAPASLHLVLTDWHRWADDEAEAWSAHERRERLQGRWPAGPPGAYASPPAVFTTPTLATPPDANVADGGPARQAGATPLASLAARHMEAARGAWSGVLLRRSAARGPHALQAAWAVRAAPRQVRAVLQYVPGEALGAAAAAALAFVPCGFAVWNRTPRSPQERDDAMTAAMRGEVPVADEDARSDDALRLLPLARLPLVLPEPELQAIHAWLREHAGQRFGGVQAVAPALVFEIAFARLHASRRHRLGAVLEEARVVRWLAEAASGGADRAGDLLEGSGVGSPT
jgi:DNA ligase-1